MGQKGKRILGRLAEANTHQKNERITRQSSWKERRYPGGKGKAHNTFMPEVEGKGWIKDRTDSAPNIQISSLQHGQYTAKVFSSSTAGRALSSDPARLFLCVHVLCIDMSLICR